MASIACTACGALGSEFNARCHACGAALPASSLTVEAPGTPPGSSAPASLAPGDLVADRFRLVRELGRGGMGSVWLARHVTLDVSCAVKFVHDTPGAAPDLALRFEREAKAAAQLKSRYVVGVVDHGIWGGRPYIAMELLEGEDLGARLRRAGRLGGEETLTIATQIARGLEKAHARGVIHRDLKPANVFLTRDDDGPVAKILDFGIAKIEGQSLGAAPPTVKGTLLGTPHYMSPEQVNGAPVDARSDLWALAVIVIECLTGRRPFEGDSLGELFAAITTRPIPPAIGAMEGLPAGVEAWWRRAVERDPAKRFQAASELADGLREALAAAPGPAPAAHDEGTSKTRRGIIVALALGAIGAAAFSISRGPAPAGATGASAGATASASAAEPKAPVGPPREEAPSPSAAASVAAATAASAPAAATSALLTAPPKAPVRPAPRPPSPSCNPPFAVGDDGIQRMKPECL